MFHTIDNAFATHYEPAHGLELVQTPPKQTLWMEWQTLARGMLEGGNILLVANSLFCYQNPNVYTQTLNQNETMIKNCIRDNCAP